MPRLGRRYPGILALISIGAALTITFFFCPRFVLWRGLEFSPAWCNPEVNRAVSTLDQLKHPFASVTNPSNLVITWRLLFPLVWHYLALPSWSFLILPQLGCLFTLGLTAHIVFQRTTHCLWTFLATVLAGACSWFFVSSGWLTYFDSWMTMGLLVLAFGRSRVALVVVCLLVPWIDERFILAIPLCMMVRVIDARSRERRSTRELVWDGLAVLVPSLAYSLLRILLIWGGPSSVEVAQYAHDNFTWTRVASVSLLRYLDGVWSGLRGGWFFVAVLFWSLWVTNRRLLGGILAIVLAGTIGVGLVVSADLSRNMCLVLPLSLLGVLDLARYKPLVLRIVLPLVAVANLLLPAAHVITLFKVPIFYVYTEIDRWQHPPQCLDPAFYTQLGIQFAAQAEFSRSDSYFDTALKLDPAFAAAYRERAASRANRGDLEGAAYDADQFVDRDPHNPDAYYLRALIRQRRQNPFGAASDLSTAMRIAPIEWSYRQGAHDMLNKLGFKSQGMGNGKEAISHLREAIRASPDDLTLLNDTAWMLATNPDAAIRNGAEAVELARRAVSQSGGNEPAILDTLAASYAEAGRFPEAEETARKAQDLAMQKNKQPLANSIAVRIRLYHAKTPFRDSRPEQ